MKTMIAIIVAGATILGIVGRFFFKFLDFEKQKRKIAERERDEAITLIKKNDEVNHETKKLAEEIYNGVDDIRASELLSKPIAKTNKIPSSKKS